MNVLVPRPGGYYDGLRADLVADLPWLISGKAHAHKDGQCACGGAWCAREDALIAQLPEEPSC